MEGLEAFKAKDLSPSFKAIDAEAINEGIVLTHADELEAQKAYLEGSLRGYELRLEGVQSTWLLPKERDAPGEAE